MHCNKNAPKQFMLFGTFIRRWFGQNPTEIINLTRKNFFSMVIQIRCTSSRRCCTNNNNILKWLTPKPKGLSNMH